MERLSVWSTLSFCRIGQHQISAKLPSDFISRELQAHKPIFNVLGRAISKTFPESAASLGYDGRDGADYSSDAPESRSRSICLQISWCSLRRIWSAPPNSRARLSASAAAHLSVSSSASSMRCSRSVAEANERQSSRAKQQTISSNLASRCRRSFSSSLFGALSFIIAS
jgi:hypothetical protein